MALHPVIMAGGSGTRFWPLSRSHRPKQLLPLTGARPLLVETVERVRPLAPAANTLVVCGKAHAAQIRRMLPRLPRANLLVEPAARNTAPCIALAAAVVARKDPQGILVVLPSDHHIALADAWRDALRAAAAVAQKGLLVTLGVEPGYPETGYGYLQRGKVLEPGSRAFRVERFVEKPDLATAKSYLSSGDYLWNAGIFVFRADRILEEIRRRLPEAVAPLAALEKAVGTRGFSRALARHFPKMPSVSLDYGVMEKAGGIAVVPANVGWCDVGSFPALCGVRRLDAWANVVTGEAVLVDVADSVVLAGKRPVAVIGMKDVVVVDAGDAVLVCPKSRAQDVRRVVEELSRRRLGRYL